MEGQHSSKKYKVKQFKTSYIGQNQDSHVEQASTRLLKPD